jgi:methylmalonyl-CoA mutase
MYVGRPWTVRQYAGFATARESNRFYRDNLARGQSGLSVAFDLPTHRGYDSDHPRASGDVGKAGVAIDSIEDMAVLFEGIDLEQVSVSMTMNGAVLPVLGAYFALAAERGNAPDRLRGTIQNDILKEFMVRHTYIYPPAPSMRVTADVIGLCAATFPKFNPVSISGYHMQEAGATAVQELAYTLGNGLAYIEAALQTGGAVDDFAPRLSFFFGVGMDFFTEVAKLRAARRLWAELVRERFAPLQADSLRLRMHCQTSGVSLTAQQPLNNVVRTTVEALAAVLGGTQSLHTNSFDEALALPSDHAAAVARNTQLVLCHETDICQVIDPLGGSYFVEALTESMLQGARSLLHEVDAQGGMVHAIEAGLVQRHIARAATERQVRLERGDDKLVGVNLYATVDEAEPEIRRIDNAAVLAEQTQRLEQLRSNRDAQTVTESLERLRRIAETRQGNLLQASIECMAARATVGEVSETLEALWGRYMPKDNNVTGVYGVGFEGDPRWDKLRTQVQQFELERGRRPRLLVAKLGQDGHDRGAKLIASGFVDAGFVVDLAPMFRTPEEVAKIAIDHDVHVIGISSLAGGHETLVPRLLDALAEAGADDIAVVCGGIVPAEDRRALIARGVADLFVPGTPVLDCIDRVLTVLAQRGAP